MIKQKLVLRFPSTQVEQPVIYHLVKDFDLMVNILRADINPKKEGRLMLEMSGSEENFRQALEWLQEHGLRVMNLKQQITWVEERLLIAVPVRQSVLRELALTRPEMKVL